MNGSELIELAKTAPKLLEKIYGDLAQPGVQQVGKALGSIMGLGNTILLPIHILNEHARIVTEANFERFRKKIADTPLEEIRPVAPEIGVPLLEKFSQSSDVNLSDLYTGLLARAATEGGAKEVHPAFVKLVDLLSPDEAILLQIFHAQAETSRPILKLKAMLKKGHLPIGPYTGLELEAKLRFPENINAYLANLCGAGIIEVQWDTWLVNDSIYENLANAYKLAEMPKPPEVLSFKRQKGILNVTPFGRLFIKACLMK